jgi:hypothetical protein
MKSLLVVSNNKVMTHRNYSARFQNLCDISGAFIEMSWVNSPFDLKTINLYIKYNKDYNE